MAATRCMVAVITHLGFFLLAGAEAALGGLARRSAFQRATEDVGFFQTVIAVLTKQLGHRWFLSADFRPLSARFCSPRVGACLGLVSLKTYTASDLSPHDSGSSRAFGWFRDAAQEDRSQEGPAEHRRMELAGHCRGRNMRGRCHGSRTSSTDIAESGSVIAISIVSGKVGRCRPVSEQAIDQDRLWPPYFHLIHLLARPSSWQASRAFVLVLRAASSLIHNSGIANESA